MSCIRKYNRIKVKVLRFCGFVLGGWYVFIENINKVECFNFRIN